MGRRAAKPAPMVAARRTRSTKRLLESHRSHPQNDEILRHLAELTGLVKKLTNEGPMEDPEIPMEGTGVPLEDIQKMIEFLK